jgi:transcriptional regulator with XRE-family HTH domain
MTFGQTLQELRKAAGLSQTRLATLSDTPIDSLRNWEQDKALPRIDAATRVAKALGVSLDKLAVPAEPNGPAPKAKRPRPRKAK